jgi:penicillin-binding protein 1A
VGVSPLEMANAYATIADGGWRNTPIAITKVVFPDGHVDNLGTPHRVKAFSDGVTSVATQMLQDYITEGLGTQANYGCTNSGGKTGTTNNNTDAWFVGFTDHLSSAVWIGYPDGSIPMGTVEGQVPEGPTLPAEIWHDYMEQATAGDCAAFPKPTQPIVYLPFRGQFSVGGSSSIYTGPGGTTGSYGFSTPTNTGGQPVVTTPTTQPTSPQTTPGAPPVTSPNGTGTPGGAGAPVG